MPHQCINCGETFPEGSTDLLQGCPECEGTRFFFTETALGPEERAELKQETKADMREAIRKALEKPDYNDEVWSWEERERWLRLEPEDVREVLEEVVEEDGTTPNLQGDQTPEETTTDGPSPEALAKAKALMEGRTPSDDGDAPSEDASTPEPKASATTTPAPDEPANPTRPLPADATPEEASDGEGPTSTVRIREPGRYDIDVESLMDSNPVIVEKDGTYMVHLPSVFTSVEKDRARLRGGKNRSRN